MFAIKYAYNYSLFHSIEHLTSVDYVQQSVIVVQKLYAQYFVK